MSCLVQVYAQESEFGVRSKKPFCNTFTGCGMKRSDPDVSEGELLGLLAERIQGIMNQVGRGLFTSSMKEKELQSVNSNGRIRLLKTTKYIPK